MLCSQNDVRHTLFKLLRTSLGGTYCSYSLWDIILWIFEQQPKGQEEELVLLSCCFFQELSTSWVTLSLGVLLLGLSCGWTSAQWSDLFCNQSKSAKEKMMLLLLFSQGVISCFFRTALQYDASTVFRLFQPEGKRMHGTLLGSRRSSGQNIGHRLNEIDWKQSYVLCILIL